MELVPFLVVDYRDGVGVVVVVGGGGADSLLGDVRRDLRARRYYGYGETLSRSIGRAGGHAAAELLPKPSLPTYVGTGVGTYD